MTPFANKLFKGLTARDAKHLNKVGKQLLRIFDNLHCFNFDKNVAHLMFSMLGDIGKRLKKEPEPWKSYFSALPTEAQFLPAEKCWLEIGKIGFFIEQETLDNNSVLAHVSWFYEDGTEMFGSVISSLSEAQSFLFPLRGPAFDLMRDTNQAPRFEGLSEFAKTETDMVFVLALYQMLAIINTPRLFETEQVPIHKGLAKKTAANPMLAKHRLNPDRIIKLYADQLRDIEAGEAIAKGTPSHKRLHFVRAHIRNLPTNKIAFVKSHYRGDPNIGIIKADYQILKHKGE